MLSQEDNELVTRVGPDAPLGRLMRRYWLPALLSDEIAEPDGPPVRVRLLGESLVAFRDTGGRVGLIEEFCAHRRVSLFLGRNEDSGLRCVYHGWKYDVDGRCVDMPTEPPETDFRSRVRLAAYPTVELGGVVWAYLGDGEAPAEPRFEWTGLRPDQRVVTRTWQECNWLQALEGGIDSAHASALHTTLTPDTETRRAERHVDRAGAAQGRGRGHRLRPRLRLDPADGGRAQVGQGLSLGHAVPHLLPVRARRRRRDPATHRQRPHVRADG